MGCFFSKKPITESFVCKKPLINIEDEEESTKEYSHITEATHVPFSNSNTDTTAVWTTYEINASSNGNVSVDQDYNNLISTTRQLEHKIAFKKNMK
jgi:hypothetical protein